MRKDSGNGFHHTELGVLPVDWKIRSVRELQLDISDGNYSSKYPRADEFKSIYEYDAPRERRASARSFMKTANAVNDALVDLAWNGALPTKGHAQKFIEEKW